MNAATLCLFDLDGTLIDSEPGILGSIRHAFARVGAAVPADPVLRGWIGPPFQHTFPSALGDDPVLVEAAIAAYREHYLDQGWARHAIYPGIAELVDTLAAAGCMLGVVTAKPLPQARKVIESLPFAGRFARVYGPESDHAHAGKAPLIARALADFGVAAAAAAMIGDRRYDIEGARANHVAGIGVLWGFGDRAELEQAGAHAIAQAPEELAALLPFG